MSAPARNLLKNPQSHGPHDALGSVRAITDSSGAVVGSYTYGAWGETLSASHPSGFTMPYLFVGALGVRHDPDTGLYYMRNRWYDPTGLQRFLSRDPATTYGGIYSWMSFSSEESLGIDFGSTLTGLTLAGLSLPVLNPGGNSRNLYAYAENRPNQLIDPSGLYPALPDPGIGVPTPPSVPPMPPGVNGPGSGSPCEEVAQHITKAMCRAACESEFANDPRGKATCLRICANLGGNTCNALFAYCSHLARHPSELGRRAAENCMTVYNKLCPAGG